MDHIFVLNTLSFPAEDAEIATSLLIDAARGMLNVGVDDDRYALYADIHSLSEFELAPHFSYRDFLEELERRGEKDLQLSLLEIADKCPALNFVPDDEIEELARDVYYFPDAAYSSSVDMIALTWHLDAILLSIATSDRWRNSRVDFAKYVEGVPDTDIDTCYLNNVSCHAHGLKLKAAFCSEEQPLSIRFPACRFSDQFLEWESSLSAELRRRVAAKFTQANERRFRGGEPLFKTLEDADGIRELRFSAVQGGAVRILFYQLSNDQQAILFGFVKKSDGEGYSRAILVAKRLLAEMNSTQTMH